MKNIGAITSILAIFISLSACQSSPTSYKGSVAYKIEKDSRTSLQHLLAKNKDARRLMKYARAVLVFPNILKAGFGFGAHIGDGALIDSNKKTIGYYNTFAASYGFQAGLQGFGYALFFG